MAVNSLEVVDGIKRSGWLARVLPKPFVAGRGGGQLEKLLCLWLAALRINNDSLKLRGILDESEPESTTAK